MGTITNIPRPQLVDNPTKLGYVIPSKAPTAIVAESWPVFQDALVRLAKVNAGMRVVGVCSNAESLLRNVEVLRPSLVLIDRELPGGEFFDTLNHLSSITTHTQIVLIGSRFSDSDLKRAWIAGVRTFALKSDTTDHLTSTIRSALTHTPKSTPSLQQRVRRSVPLDGRRVSTSPLTMLTKRQFQILVLLAGGHSLAEIAKLLGLSPKTIDSHKCALMSRLQIHTQVELCLYAVREGIIAV